MKRFVSYLFLILTPLFVACQRETPFQDREEKDGPDYAIVKVSVSGSDKSDAETKTVFDISKDGIYDLHVFAFYAEAYQGNAKGSLVKLATHAGDQKGQVASFKMYTPSGQKDLSKSLPFNWALPVGVKMNVYTIVNANRSSDDSKIHSASSTLATSLDDLLNQSNLTESTFKSQSFFQETIGDDWDRYYGASQNADLASAPFIKTGWQEVTIPSLESEAVTLKVFRPFSVYSISMDASNNSSSNVSSRGFWIGLANAAVYNVNKNISYFLSSMPQSGMLSASTGVENKATAGSQLVGKGDYISESDLNNFNNGGGFTVFVTPNDQGTKSAGSSVKWYNQENYLDLSLCTYVDLHFYKYGNFSGCTSLKQAMEKENNIQGMMEVRLYLGGYDSGSPQKGNFRVVRNIRREISLQNIPTNFPENEIYWLSDGDVKMYYASDNVTASVQAAPGVAPRSAGGIVPGESMVMLYSSEEFTSEEQDANNIPDKVEWSIQSDAHYIAGKIRCPQDLALKEVTFTRTRPYYRHLAPRKLTYEQIAVDCPEEIYMGQRLAAEANSTVLAGLDESKCRWYTSGVANTYLTLGASGSTWGSGSNYDQDVIQASSCLLNAKKPTTATVKFEYNQEDSNGEYSKLVYDRTVTVKAPTVVAANNVTLQILNPKTISGSDVKRYVAFLPLTRNTFEIDYFFVDDAGDPLYDIVVPDRYTGDVRCLASDLDMLECSIKTMGNSSLTSISSNNVTVNGHKITHNSKYQFRPSSSSVFNNAVNNRVSISDYTITNDSGNRIVAQSKNTSVKTGTSYLKFIDPLRTDEPLNNRGQDIVVNLADELFYFDLTNVLPKEYFNDGYLPGLSTVDEYYFASNVIVDGVSLGNGNNSQTYHPDVKSEICDYEANKGQLQYGLSYLISSDYDDYTCNKIPGKVIVRLRVTNGSYSYTITNKALCHFYRAVHYRAGITARCANVFDMPNHVDHVTVGIYPNFYLPYSESYNEFNGGSCIYFISENDSHIYISTGNVVPGVGLNNIESRNYSWSDDLNACDSGFKNSALCGFDLYRTSSNSASFSSIIDENVTSNTIPKVNFYRFLNHNIKIKDSYPVNIGMTSPTYRFFDKGVDEYDDWPRLIYVTQWTDNMWTDSPAFLDETYDSYKFHIYYDNYYSKKEWDDYTDGEKVGLITLYTTFPLFSNIAIDRYRDGWLYRRDAIAFGLEMSVVDGNGQESFVYPSQLGNYIDSIELYVDQQKTSTRTIPFNQLLEYSFDWCSNRQEWADGINPDRIYYGDNESTRLIPFFFDENSNCIEDASYRGPSLGNNLQKSFTRGLRLNPNVNYNMPVLKVASRTLSYLSFTPFYGIKRIILKDQFETIADGSNYFNSPKEYIEHYEPYYGSVVTSGDWE